jgi:hypothetical protein
MNMNVEMNLGNNGNGNGNNAIQHENNAIQVLLNQMSTIPQSNQVASAMILDWVNNVGPEDMNNLKYEDIRELVEGMYQDVGENPPGFVDDDYKQMFNFFTSFVQNYYGEANIIQGGKHRGRRHHKRRQTKKKSRRGPKKTRRHK